MTKKSMAAAWKRWFRRKVRHACEGGLPGAGRDGGLCDMEAQLEQLSVNPRRAPSRVVSREAAHERPDFIGRARTTSPRGAQAPEEPEARAVPSEDGVRLHDDQELPPPRPQARDGDPEEPVERAQLRSRRSPLQNGELVAESEVLEDQR